MATGLIRRAIARVSASVLGASVILNQVHSSEAKAQLLEPSLKPTSYIKSFQIYRWNPDGPQKLELQNYEVDLKEYGPIVSLYGRPNHPNRAISWGATEISSVVMLELDLCPLKIG